MMSNRLISLRQWPGCSWLCFHLTKKNNQQLFKNKTTLREPYNTGLRLKHPLHHRDQEDCIRRQEKWLHFDLIALSPGQQNTTWRCLPLDWFFQSERKTQEGQAGPSRIVGHLAGASTYSSLTPWKGQENLWASTSRNVTTMEEEEWHVTTST